MKKSTLFLIILVAIFFTSTLVLLYLNLNKRPATTSTPTIATIPTQTSTPDPTANWKTYENKEYGFSLEIPNYLITKSRPNFPLRIDFWNESDDTTGYYKYYRNILLNDPENYKLPLFWIYIDGNSMKALQGDGGNGPQELSYIKPINENFGLFYFGFDFTDQVCATEKNDKTIMVECSDKNLSDTLFNQILSTFKFTNDIQSDNLKTKIVEENGIKVTISPDSGPVGTKVTVSITGMTANPNLPFASLSFNNDQGYGEDSLTNKGIDTRNFGVNGSYTTTYVIPTKVLVLFAGQNAGEANTPVPTHIGNGFINLSYQDKNIKIPFTVTD